MNNTICSIPADNSGNKLLLKDFREENQKMFIKYRSTFNDIPFRDTELIPVDDGNNLAITGDDGTVLFRFSVAWIGKLID